MNNKEFRESYKVKQNISYDPTAYPFGAEEMLDLRDIGSIEIGDNKEKRCDDNGLTH